VTSGMLGRFLAKALCSTDIDEEDSASEMPIIVSDRKTCF